MTDHHPLTLRDRASLGAAIVVPVILGGGVPALGNLLVLPLMAEYHASRATIILLLETGMVGNLLVAPIIGRLLLRIVPWMILLTGAIGGALALLAACTMHSLGGTMTGIGLAHMFGAGFCGTVAAQTFVVRRSPGRLGIISGGQTVMSAVTGVIISLAIPPILVASGWRTATGWYALIALLLLVPMILGLMRSPATRKDGAAGTPCAPEEMATATSAPKTMDILRMGAFWLLMIAIIPLAIAALAVSINVIPFLAERGVGTQQAGFVLAGIGAVSAIGALSIGAIVDRFHPALVMAGIGALAAAGLAAVATGIGNPAYFLIAIYFGLPGVAPTLAVGVKRLFGSAAYPPIMGLVGPFLLLSAFSGAGTGWLRDHLGSYLPVFAIMAALCGVSLAASVLLMRRALVEG